jgi:hypothetical protein
MNNATQALRPFFQSPYSQYGHYNGKPFELLGESNAAYDKEEVGAMYMIKIEGETIEAWPEEIFAD